MKKLFFRPYQSSRDIKNINWLSYLLENSLKEIKKTFFRSEFLKKLCKNENINFYYEC
ncbi:hypothetical protein J530_0075 [Acinetobacter baumannii 15827]|nr:hypothetical protein J530_0075 [Acinetobacter baumannii 15827]